MKRVCYLCSITVAISLLLITNIASANWYSGGGRWGTNGIQANISTPSNLNIIPINQSGEENYVSNYFSDANGTDWLQAGWEFYYNSDSIPKQYVEWCIDCIGTQGIHVRNDQFAHQDWGVSYFYKVKFEGSSTWCAYTQNTLRYCVDNLDYGYLYVEADSEIHTSALNPLNTTFDMVQYNDPTDGIWKNFDNNAIMGADFPYSYQVISPYSNFRTFRLQFIYLPLLSK